MPSPGVARLRSRATTGESTITPGRAEIIRISILAGRRRHQQAEQVIEAPT